MKRRSFLSGSLLAGAGVATGRALPDAPCPIIVPRHLPSMATQLLRSDNPLDLGLRWAAGGASFRDLLGAGYLAGLQEINPSPIGGQVHALMMVASAAEVGASMRGREQLLPALFNLERIKSSQGRDSGSRRGDWKMPAAPEVEVGAVAEHADAFATAMHEWDEKAGDRAVVALHQALPMDDFFELLWPWAARDFRIIGHKIIFAAQSYRALQEIGWRYGRDAVRSLAQGLLDENPFGRFSDDDTKAILALFDSNRERGARFPADWAARRSDRSASLALLARLRDSSAEGAADAVLERLNAGDSAQAVWDGIRLRAFELTMQFPSIAGVHTVTSVNALHRVAMITNIEATKRLCVLQAASWMPLFGELLAGRRQATDRAIETLDDGAEKVRSDPFRGEAFRDRARRAVTAVSADGFGDYRKRALALLARKAAHDHDYKFTVAAMEEVRWASPETRGLLAGAAMRMLRHEGSDDSDVYRAVRRKL